MNRISTVSPSFAPAAMPHTPMCCVSLQRAHLRAPEILVTDITCKDAGKTAAGTQRTGLVQRSAQEVRDANREIGSSELNAQVGQLTGAASGMQKAPNFRLAAGIVQDAMPACGSIRAAAKSAQTMGPQTEAQQADRSASKLLGGAGDHRGTALRRRLRRHKRTELLLKAVTAAQADHAAA